MNIRIFNDPSSSTPCTSVVRKENFKYDVIPFNSNVSHHFKLMAGKSYFRTAKSHSNTISELANQNRIVYSILKFKNFSNTIIHQMKRQKRSSPLSSSTKKFLGKTVFDNVSLRHSFISRVFKSSTLDKNIYYLPMPVPGPKLEQYIFSIRKMRKILNF